MHPKFLLFTWHHQEIAFGAYELFLLIAFIGAGIWCHSQAQRFKLPPLHIQKLYIYMLVAGLIGSRVLHVLADGYLDRYVHLCFHPEQVLPLYPPPVLKCFSDAECSPAGLLCNLNSQKCHLPQDCWAWAKLWQGGLVFYGGLLFALPVAAYYCRKNKLNLWRVADLASGAMALGLFLGRIGCFLEGCCFGKPSGLPWGIKFPPFSAVWEAHIRDKLIMRGALSSLPVHPTQLYEAAGCLVIFLCLIHPSKNKPGQRIGWFLVLYAILRSLCEVFRADDRGIFLHYFSTAQLISIPMAGLGLFLILRHAQSVISDPRTSSENNA